MKGTMNLAKTSFSREICAGAKISVVQYLAPLRFGFRYNVAQPAQASTGLVQHGCFSSPKLKTIGAFSVESTISDILSGFSSCKTVSEMRRLSLFV
jgi:hypothetical protein